MSLDELVALNKKALKAKAAPAAGASAKKPAGVPGGAKAKGKKNKPATGGAGADRGPAKQRPAQPAKHAVGQARAKLQRGDAANTRRGLATSGGGARQQQQQAYGQALDKTKKAAAKKRKPNTVLLKGGGAKAAPKSNTKPVRAGNKKDMVVIDAAGHARPVQINKFKLPPNTQLTITLTEKKSAPPARAAAKPNANKKPPARGLGSKPTVTIGGGAKAAGKNRAAPKPREQKKVPAAPNGTALRRGAATDKAKKGRNEKFASNRMDTSGGGGGGGNRRQGRN